MKKFTLSNHHTDSKEVSTYPIYNGEMNKLISIHIQKDGRLNKHFTKTAATLICIEGQAKFSDENGFSEIIKPGDYITIDPDIVHWVDGLEDSQLLLVK